MSEADFGRGYQLEGELDGVVSRLHKENLSLETRCERNERALAELVAGEAVVSQTQYDELHIALENERAFREGLLEIQDGAISKLRLAHKAEMEKLEEFLADARKSRDSWALYLNKSDIEVEKLREQIRELES